MEDEDYIDYILAKILVVYSRNIFIEKRSAIWDTCYEYQRKVGLNRENLENMAGNTLVTGFFGFTDNRDMDPVIISDTLFRLAVAVGVRGLQNPEGGYHHQPVVNSIKLTDSELLTEIEKETGFKIHLPQFVGGKDIVRTDRGIITTRIVYYMWVLKRIMELCPARDSAIIEVGAGLGILGYYLSKAGYKDYTAIDLANANACQAYFLARNLPEREIIFSNSAEDPLSPGYRNCLKILHVNDFEGIPKNRFAIMVNMDGMTEMNKGDAIRYIGDDCSPLLLSINHEMNDFRVIDIIYRGGKKLVYRYPFWLRDGYVEELYKK